MTIDEFIAEIENKSPPAPGEAIAKLEAEIGFSLPSDYRDFLSRCNGGYVGGRLWFNPDVGVHHIGGFREETYFSLQSHRGCYQSPDDIRIPTDLLWVMDDPFGNAICLGLAEPYRGKVYFWDHEMEPNPDEWDGKVESAGNITCVAETFKDFVSGLHVMEDDDVA